MTDIFTALPYARLPSGHSVPHDDRALNIYRVIDAEAARRGAVYAARVAALEELHARQISPEITARCTYLLDALERDPSGRLAALPDLYADTGAGDISPRWLDAYNALLRVWLVRQRALAAA